MKDLGDRILNHKKNVDNTRKVLNDCSDITVDNFKRLINQAGDLEPALLENFMGRTELIQKLFNVGLDPQFIAKILDKGSKVDLDLFEKVMMKADPENIEDLFEFFPGANGLDFDGVGMLFEKGNNSDPETINKILDDPDLFANIYSKGNNDPNMLKKIVQKGNKFDKDMVTKLYSKQPSEFEKNIMGAKVNFQRSPPKRKDSSDYMSVQNQKHSGRELNLNRTGAGFPKVKTTKKSKDEDFSEANSGVQLAGDNHYMGGVHYEYQIREVPADEVVKKRKPPKAPKTRKVVDIRLPSE